MPHSVPCSLYNWQSFPYFCATLLVPKRNIGSFELLPPPNASGCSLSTQEIAMWKFHISNNPSSKPWSHLLQWFHYTFTYSLCQYPKLNQGLQLPYFGHLTITDVNSFHVFHCDGIPMDSGTAPMSLMYTP